MTGKPAQESHDPRDTHFREMSAHDAAINVRQLMLNFWHHKLILIVTTIIALSCTFMYISLTKAVYRSSSEIKINTNNTDLQTSNISAFFSGGRISSSAVQNEVAVLKSRSQIKQLARQLDLYRIKDLDGFTTDDMPDISPTQAPNQFKSLDLAPRRDNEKDNEENRHPGQPDRAVIDRIIENLKVHNIAGTTVIEIAYRSPNPDLSAAIPQLLAELYIKKTMTARLKASNRLRSWLQQRLRELRKKLRKAEKRIAEFQRDNDFLVDNKSNILLSRLTKTNSQIISTQSELSQKRLRLQQARTILKTDSKQAYSATSLNSKTLTTLKKQERALLNKKAEAMTRYGPKHPEIKAIQAELETVRKEFHSAIREHITQLEHEVELLATQLAEQEKRFQEQRQRFNNKKAAIIKLKELKREAAGTQSIYDSFLKKYKRAIDTQKLERPEAEIISNATTPDNPVFPKKRLLFALSVIVGIVGGAIIVILITVLNTSYYSLSELERDGMDTLGIVPLLKGRDKHTARDTTLKSEAKIPIAEALRNIYMHIRLRSHYRDRTISVCAVTSTLSGEGKTSTAGWLAQAAAQSGASVCVVDGDMRKPGLHHFFRLDNDKALLDYLASHAGLDDIIQHSTTVGVDVITSRSTDGALEGLLNGNRIKQLIAELKHRYDFVIIDTPALLAVPDARFITLHADHIAYLVTWNDTSRDMLQRGLNALKGISGDNISAILSRVDTRRQARRGYSDMLYYYTQERKHA
jgi:capsular exopolysaccharide synthesis family protein